MVQTLPYGGFIRAQRGGKGQRLSRGGAGRFPKRNGQRTGAYGGQKGSGGAGKYGQRGNTGRKGFGGNGGRYGQGGQVRAQGNAGKGSRQGATAQAPAAVNLSTEVQSLRVRHDALVARLPADLRRLDAQVLPVIQQLPSLAQVSYLTTIEDYPTLSTTEQARLKEVMQSVAGLAETDRQRFVQSAAVSFGRLQSSEAELKAARDRPHETCFMLKDEVERLLAPPPAAPPATSAPAAAPANEGKKPASAASTAPARKARKPKQ
jgi:hypothetical protein